MNILKKYNFIYKFIIFILILTILETIINLIIPLNNTLNQLITLISTTIYIFITNINKGKQIEKKAYIEGLKAISKADMLLVCGSSLTVFPAAGMISSFNGKYLVIINNDETPYDSRANLVIHDNLSKVSNYILKKI